jgi:putative adhesin
MPRAFAGLSLLFWVVSASAVAAEGPAIQRTVALDARGAVSIETFKGAVDVQTWDEPRAEISARIEPDTGCGNNAQQMERVRLTKVDIDSTPARLSIRSNYDALEGLDRIRMEIKGMDMACNAHPFVLYELRIPRTARLDISDHKSKITVTGLHADARIASHKGSVFVNDHDGGLDFRTHKGDAHVEFARLAESRLETYKGDIEVAVPRAAGFDLDARVERRGLLETPFTLDETQVSRRERIYEQKINGGGPLLEMSTRNGRLRITEK